MVAVGTAERPGVAERFFLSARSAALIEVVSGYLYHLYEQKGQALTPDNERLAVSALIFYERYERFGFPFNPPVWSAQPLRLISDLEAIRSGKERYAQLRQVNENLERQRQQVNESNGSAGRKTLFDNPGGLNAYFQRR